MADIIGDLFFGASDTLNDAEQSIMTDILRQLVQDVEVSVRKHLAIQLSNQDQAPHDLVIALANDDSEVAYPLLPRSRVLRDQDLVAIIHHRTLEHQLAVSMRDSISPTVSDSLAKTGEETVIKRLLENPNAEIACDTMAHLVEQSRRLDSLQKPLVHRSDLPGDLAEKMYWWVSAALRSHIVEHFDVDANEIDAAMESAVNTAFDTQGEDDAVLSATDRVAKHLAEKQDPDGDLIIRLLRESEITLFERVIEQIGPDNRPSRRAKQRTTCSDRPRLTREDGLTTAKNKNEQRTTETAKQTENPKANPHLRKSKQQKQATGKPAPEQHHRKPST